MSVFVGQDYDLIESQKMTVFEKAAMERYIVKREAEEGTDTSAVPDRWENDIPGPNSTRPTQVVKQGKLDPISDSTARHPGCPANLTAITLFDLCIETMKIFLIF